MKTIASIATVALVALGGCATSDATSTNGSTTGSTPTSAASATSATPTPAPATTPVPTLAPTTAPTTAAPAPTPTGEFDGAKAAIDTLGLCDGNWVADDAAYDFYPDGVDTAYLPVETAACEGSADTPGVARWASEADMESYFDGMVETHQQMKTASSDQAMLALGGGVAIGLNQFGTDVNNRDAIATLHGELGGDIHDSQSTFIN